MTIGFRVSFTRFYGAGEKSRRTFYFPGKEQRMINCYEK